MDNITHTLFGAALAKTRLGRGSALSSAALIVTANFPDVDIISALWEPPSYLVHHRGITHSVFGIVIEAFLLAWIFWMIERRFFRKDSVGVSNFRPLLLASFVGLSSHLLLDSLNTYGVRPWLPFSDSWIYGDLLFIVDPYLWLLLAGMTFWPQGRSRFGTVALFLFVIGTEWIVATNSRAPEFLKIVYPILLLILLCGRWMFRAKKSDSRIFIAGCCCLAFYLALLFTVRTKLQQETKTDLAEDSSLQRSMMSPMPANPFSWNFLGETEKNLFSTRPVLFAPRTAFRRIDKNLDSPYVQSTLATPRGQAWLGFARYPFAVIEDIGQRVRVHLLDARYQLAPPAGVLGWVVEVEKSK